MKIKKAIQRILDAEEEESKGLSGIRRHIYKMVKEGEEAAIGGDSQ